MQIAELTTRRGSDAAPAPARLELADRPKARPAPARSRGRAVSLRTDLLVNLATLATAALLLAITTIILFDAMITGPGGLVLLTGLVTADIVVFLLFGYHLTGRLVLQPLDDVVHAADRIAQGERSERVAENGAPEFVRLARAINAMTDQLIAEQERVLRVEKMASLGRLAAGVAHEVGNPLGAINGYTHLLKRRLSGNAEALGMVSDLEREASRVDRIMRGLLDYARPRRATPHLVYVPECVSRVAGFLRDQRALARVTVALDLEVGLPPVRADSHALDQVLVNLFLNAAQAMPGGGTIHVSAHLTTLDRAIGRGPRRASDEDRALMPRNAVRRIGAWRDGPMPDAFIELIVADSGPGIPDDDLERVFDPFFTTKAPGEGTGLGLAIVSRVVEDAGGIVFARRAREGGAAFVVLLPAVIDDARPARRALACGSVA